MSERWTWQLRDRALSWSGPARIMGIVNVTPDSFSDGGQHGTTESAVAHALKLVEQGAAILDIGGESSRPGAVPVSLDEELRRVIPVIEQLRARTDVPLSVDTCKAAVARAALEAGADIINDITALQGDPEMAEVVRAHQAGVVLMHMQGTPATMQLAPAYADVVREVGELLEARLQAAADVGISGARVVLDPGIGFGKTTEHNLRLLAGLGRLSALGRPICLGVSRKGFLGAVLDRLRGQRLAGSLAAICHALAHGSAQVLRVHDVAETRDAVELFRAIEEAS
jgi:dihydropteroate synthase